VLLSRLPGAGRGEVSRLRGLTGASAPETGPKDVDHLVLLGEFSAAEETSQQPLRSLARYALSVHEDVELPEGSGSDLGLEPELALDRGGETRRPGLVTSGRAVEDLDVAHRIEL
jgi:hypothetical protein